jgi:hypothetical protein
MVGGTHGLRGERDCLKRSSFMELRGADMNVRIVVAVLVLAGGAVGCAPVTEQATSAPEVAAESVAPRDVGTSYDGWTQSLAYTISTSSGSGTYHHALSRASGDSTRGGGACAVVRQPGSSCSADDTCTTAAQNVHGPSAYGYCYSGECYFRPGAQASFCALNPNRSPGTLTGAPTWYSDDDYVVGCMTKTAGPNTACGGSNASLYMRTMLAASYSDLPWCSQVGCQTGSTCAAECALPCLCQ